MPQQSKRSLTLLFGFLPFLTASGLFLAIAILIITAITILLSLLL